MDRKFQVGEECLAFDVENMIYHEALVLDWITDPETIAYGVEIQRDEPPFYLISCETKYSETGRGRFMIAERFLKKKSDGDEDNDDIAFEKFMTNLNLQSYKKPEKA